MSFNSWKAIALILVSGHAVAQTWKPVDKASKVSFEIKNFGVTVEGELSGMEGTIQFDPEHVEKSVFSVSVSSSSINTGIDLRDKHLRKKEYLDAATYARITFVSHNVTGTPDPNKWIMKGSLTIKKTTKEISIPFTVKSRGANYLFDGSFNIDRQQFDVGGNSFSMADSLTIKLNVIIEKTLDQ